MNYNRRTFVSSTALGALGLIPSRFYLENRPKTIKGISETYPGTDLVDLKAVVGAAHTKLDVVKELVTARPELAKATYDWGFGDVESALGAASHMGRKDIAEFLISYGARPDIYTYAMLGKVNTVKAMIEDMPGIQKIRGPHGFTLLHHAMMRLRRKNVEGQEKMEQEELVAYLQTIEGANTREPSMEISEAEREIYVGKYYYGEGEDDYFELNVNGMDMLSIQRPSQFGRSLKYVGEHSFAPGGAPSVRIVFSVEDGISKNFTIHDPSPIVTAFRK